MRFAATLTAVLFATVGILGGPGRAAAEEPLGILLAAGDIAECDPAAADDEATARILGVEIRSAERRNIPIRVLALGDLAYPNGTAAQFRCFDRSWGKYYKNILPVPGNHEYKTAKAAPFFDYFNSKAFVSSNGRRAGYYSLDFPADSPWHIIGLNSAIDIAEDSPQFRWLKADLDGTPASCIVAFSHHAVFSSGRHGHGSSEDPNAQLVQKPEMVDVFKLLDRRGASLMLTGHDHNFEQLASQHASGEASSEGVRSFVLGTGGARLYNQVDYVTQASNSEAFNDTSKGVLKIRLFPDRYEWNFLPIEGDADILLPVTSEACSPRPPI